MPIGFPVSNLITTIYKIKSINIKELIRFGFSGLINTILGYLVYSFFIFIGFTYYIALLVSYLFAVVYSLFVNYYFTFKLENTVNFKMLFKMILTYGILFLINEVFLYVLVSKMRFNEYFGQAVLSLVIAVISYILQRQFVFKVDTVSKI